MEFDDSIEPRPDADQPRVPEPIAETDNPYTLPIQTPAQLDPGDPSMPWPSSFPTPLTTPDSTSFSTPDSKPSRPRAWTSFLVVGLSGLSFLVASTFLTLVAIYVVHGAIDLKTIGSEGMLRSVMGSRIGLVIMVVLPQIALVAPAIIAAMMSPEATHRRLGLVRGHWPLWTWIAAAFATPLVGMVSALVVGMFMHESESIKELTSVFRGHGENGFLIPLALMIGLTPAVCEELLFRGYMQTRLVKSVGPWAGVLTASVLFALLHMDVVHVIAVFPLGLFLGWVTWRSGSLIPAMMGHFINNSISVVLAVHISDDDPTQVTIAMIAFMAAILALGAAGFAATCYASVTFQSPEST